MSIHPTAIIEKGAIIADDVEIGPYAVIGSDVKIGSGTIIDSMVCIDGFTEIGKNCKIYHGASLGKAPQDLKFKNEKTYLKIGDGNVIREYVTIHRATGDGSSTIVGDNNFIMAYVHIGHNCVFGSNIIVSNATSFAGHIQVEDKAVISGMTGFHQFVRVGSLAMVGGCARVTKDVPPYSTVAGSPARLFGLNVIGLRRNNIGSEIRNTLKNAYKLLEKMPRLKALEEIQNNMPQSPELQHLIEFLSTNSARGFTLRLAGKHEEDSLL